MRACACAKTLQDQPRCGYWVLGELGAIGGSFILLPRILWCGVSFAFARAFPPREARTKTSQTTSPNFVWFREASCSPGFCGVRGVFCARFSSSGFLLFCSPGFLWCWVSFARAFLLGRLKSFPAALDIWPPEEEKRAQKTPHTQRFPAPAPRTPLHPAFPTAFIFALALLGPRPRSSSSRGLVIERLTWRKRKMKNNEQRTTGRARAFRAAFRALSLFVYFPHDFPPARYHQTSRPIFMDTPVWAA